MNATRADRLSGITERRIVGLTDDFEMRATDDATTIAFKGYASLFNVEYEMYGGPEKGGWIESVHPDAFKRTLTAKPDVVLNMNHGAGGTGLPIARTSSGTLSLRADKVGLLGEAPALDMRDPDVQALAVKSERKDITQMSFAFRTMRQEWDAEYEHRVLLELSLDNGDISIVTNGASPTTSFQLRSLDEAIELLANMDPEQAFAEVRALEEDKRTYLSAAVDLLTKLAADETPGAQSDEARGAMTVAQARRIALLDAR